MKNSFGFGNKVQGLIGSSLYLALCLFSSEAFAQQTQPKSNFSVQDQNTCMCMRRAGMGMSHDSEAMAEMGVIHQLMVNHDLISRTVTNLPDGVRTVTESDDPQIAKLIKEHVASMAGRVSAKDDPGMPMESPDLHSILRNGDKIQTKTETTDKGAVVIQTSTDAAVAAALQRHAAEVTDLVKGGMAAMHSATMKNRGDNTQSGMQCPMMGPERGGKTPPNQK